MMGWVGLSCVSESGATSNSASTLHAAAAAAAAMTSVNDDDTAETALLVSRRHVIDGHVTDGRTTMHIRTQCPQTRYAATTVQPPDEC